MKIQLFILLISALSVANTATITNQISPTANPLNYVVSFSQNGSTILSTPTQIGLVTCTITTPSTTTSTACTGTWICSDKTCMLFTLSATTIPLKSTVTIDFTAVNSGSTTFTNAKLTANAIAYDTPSDLMTTLKTMEFYMAIIWGGLALINMFPTPYSLVYLVGKLYMETLDTFKMANIHYSSWANTYYYYDSNKVAGLRVPNLFSILLHGDTWNSGYDLENYAWVSLSTRGTDNKLYAFEKFQQYTPYALFLDNYGIQIESMVITLFFIGFVEFIRWIVLRNKNRKEGNFTRKARYVLRWNLFYALFFGSYLTALFYGISQIFAYINSSSTTNNLISFAVGVSVLGILLILTIITFVRIRRLLKNNVYSANSFHSILVRPYKPEKFKYPLNLILLVLKTIGFVTVLVIPNIDPLAQVSILLGLELGYFLYIVIVRPFASKTWLFFQILYEILLMLVISCMLVIAIADYQNDFTDSLRQIPTLIIVYCSIALPYLNSVFAIDEIIKAIINRKKQGDQVTPTKEGQNTEVPASYIDPATVQAFKADPFISIDKTDYPRNNVFAEVSIDHAERGPVNNFNVPQNNRLNQYGHDGSNNNSKNEVLPESFREREGAVIKPERIEFKEEKPEKVTKFSINDFENGGFGKKFQVNPTNGPVIVDHRVENNFLKTRENYPEGVFNVSHQTMPHTQLDTEYRNISRNYDERSNHNHHGIEPLTNVNYLTGDKSNFQSPTDYNTYNPGKIETKLNFDNVRTDPPPIRNKNTIPSKLLDNRVHVFNDYTNSSRHNLNSGRTNLNLNDKSKSYIDEDGFKNYTNKFSIGM